MTRSALGRILGAALLVALGLHVTPGAANSAGAAVNQHATGWWWAGRPSETFPETIRPAPSVPEGGLYVSSSPSGSTGVSALRYEWPAGSVSPVLTLHVAEAVGTPALTACAAGSDWEPVEGGPWDQRPAADCAINAAAGTLSADGKQVAFDLWSFTPTAQLDVVVVPTIDPLSPAAPTFAVSFKPPGPDALVFSKGFDEYEDEEPMPHGDDDAGFAFDESNFSFERDFPLSPSVDVLPPAAAPVRPPARTPPASGAQRVAAVALPPDVFPYSSILTLILVVLAVGSYLARTLSRPVAPRLALVRTPVTRPGRTPGTRAP